MTIRTGIIGFGLSGQVFHEPALSANPEFSVDLIATSNPDRVAEARSRGHQVVDGPEELLARASELDLVVLSAPPSVHAPQALAALAAGAAVVTDKPFAASVSAAESMIAAAEASDRQLFVYQNRRWDGDFLTMRKVIAEGMLGKVFRFESTIERWGTPQLRAEWQGSLSAADGGGVLFDLGSHIIDQALHLFGPAELEHAELGFIREGRVSEDDAFLALAHESGVRSHLTMSRVAGASGPRFRVLGTSAAYTVSGVDGQEDYLKAGGKTTDAAYGVTPEEQWGAVTPGNTQSGIRTIPTVRGDYPAFYRGVADTLLNGAPRPVDPADSLAGLRIIERAHEIGIRRTILG